jgi:hypothetical protein
MKLCTFEYQVDFPRTPEEIADSVQIALRKEAELQGWEDGYTISTCQLPRRLPNGGSVHIFEVEGTYSTSSGNNEEDAERKGAESGTEDSSDQVAQAPELDQ